MAKQRINWLEASFRGIIIVIALLILLGVGIAVARGDTIGQQIDDVHATGQERLDSHEWDINELQSEMGVVNAWIAAHSLGTGVPPVVVPPIVIPPIDPPPVADDDRYFCVNLDFTWQEDKPWRPDKPINADGSLNQEYVDLIRPVADGLRFLNPNLINKDRTHYTSLTQEWRDRLDWQIELCNEVDADFWFNAPYHASDQFIHEAMTYIRARLSARNLTYFEWSNEVWNGAQPAYQMTKDIGGGEDMASVGFMTQWATKVASANRAARLADPTCILVVGNQNGNPWLVKELHKYLVAQGADNYDAVAITFYVGTRGEINDSTTLNQLFAAMDASADRAIPKTLQIMDWCQANGKRALFYEGGGHLTAYSGGDTLKNTMKRAQSDIRYVQVLDRYLIAIDSHPLGLDKKYWFDFVSTYTVHGFWGFHSNLEDMANSLKYEWAIQKRLEN